MEDIEYLKNCIVYSIGNEETGMTESCEEYKRVIDRVLDRLEQLERENESLVAQYEWQGAKMVNEYMPLETIKKLFIPKSLIRKKIKELEEMLPNQYVYIDYTKKMLKELLGDEQ